MVELNLSPDPAGEPLTLGPAPWFRVERNELRQGPTEILVGEMRGRSWRLAGRPFPTLEANGTLLRFAGHGAPSGAAQGPYRELRFVDGSLYGDGQLVAYFDDETYLWRESQTSRSWPSVLLVDR